MIHGAGLMDEGRNKRTKWKRGQRKARFLIHHNCNPHRQLSSLSTRQDTYEYHKTHKTHPKLNPVLFIGSPMIDLVTEASPATPAVQPRRGRLAEFGSPRPTPSLSQGIVSSPIFHASIQTRGLLYTVYAPWNSDAGSGCTFLTRWYRSCES